MRPFAFLLLVLAVVTMAMPAEPKGKKRATGEPRYDGIDISRHNGEIDWKKVAENPNIKYVYIKATEGRRYSRVDYFHTNQRRARSHGIKVGAYHYLVTSSPIQKQFDHFRSVVKPSDIDLIPVIDYEIESGDWTPQQARDSIKAFADLIERYYGCRPMIYTYVSLYNTQLGISLKNYPIFIACYDKAPVMQSGRWTMHQFTQTGRVEGIRGNVDLSRFNDGCSISNILYHKSAKATKKKARKKSPKATKGKSAKTTKARKKKTDKTVKTAKSGKNAKTAKATKAKTDKKSNSTKKSKSTGKSHSRKR